MALFPIFISLEDKNILVVGGGNVAYRKIEKLLPFNPNLFVVSKELSKKTEDLLKKHNIPFKKKAFEFSDLENIDIVIIAVDDIDLQKDIYMYTRDKNILVNAVDSPDYCDFIFPAYIKKGDLVIGISTSGKVPGLSAKIREFIERLLPEDIESILKELEDLRKSLPKGKERQKKIIEKIQQIFKK